MREEKGWLFPDDIGPPEQSWYQMEFGNRVVHDLDKHGHIYMAREHADLESIETEIVDSGVDADGTRWAAAETVVRLDGRTWRAVGGADSRSDQVRDPEHTHTVAATRSLKNAVKLALGIRPASSETADTEPERQSSQAPPPHPDVPDDMTEEPPEPEAAAKAAAKPSAEADDDGPAW